MKAQSLLIPLSLLFICLSCSKKDTQAPIPSANFHSSTSSLKLSGNKGAVDSFEIQSNVSWTISVAPSNIDWIQLDRTSGSGNATVHVNTIENNQSGNPISGTITISPAASSGEMPLVIQVTERIYQLDLKNAWSHLFGGGGEDGIYDMIKTPDGGYVMVGSSTSGDGDLPGNKGDADFWMMKVNVSGEIAWSHNYGGTKYDRAYSVIATSDGGFAVTGATRSSDGDITGAHGGSDMWVLKTSSSGSLEWEKTFGGSNSDYGTRIVKSSDGGYLVLGNTSSSNGDVQSKKGFLFDIWLLKLDHSGNLLWQKTYGGSDNDLGNDLLSLPDNKYLIAGSSLSHDGDRASSIGLQDSWILKVDNQGGLLSEKAYGGLGDDVARKLALTPEGDILVAGESDSQGGDVTSNHGGADYWIYKLSSAGEFLWETSFGGSGDELLNALVVNSDGSFLVTGSSTSTGGDITGHLGEEDIWTVKSSPNGVLLWQKSSGGTAKDYGRALLSNTDGSYVQSGSVWSVDNDGTGNIGLEDSWVTQFNE